MISFFSKAGRFTRVTLSIAALVLSLSAVAMAQTQSPATKQLFEAVFSGNLAEVQISIANGGDINALNAWGITPVDLAVDKGHFEIVHFLLQVRDQQSKNNKPTPSQASVTSLGVTPNKPTAPAPTAAPVGEVYSPPPDAGPWSATVVTSEPPPPPVLVAGPSPFDQESTADTALPIIGTVRGPTIDTSVQVAVEETFQKVAKQPETKSETKPEPVAETTTFKPATENIEPKKEEPGIWGNFKSLLNLDDTQQAETTPAPEPVLIVKKPQPITRKKVETKPEPVAKDETPPSMPIVEVRQSASLARPTEPVSPPNVTGPPPDIEGALLPKNVTPAPLTTLSENELETPQVLPVQSKAPTRPAVQKNDPQNTPPDTTMAKVTRLAKTRKNEPKSVTKGAPGQPAVQIGTTTPPGKPREQDGFFSKVMSIFSSEDENAKAKEDPPVAIATASQNGNNWAVKNIQQAQVLPRKPTRKVVRELPENRLEGVILSLGRTTALGKAPPPQAPAPWYYRSCINKKLGSTVFCIETLDWPEDIRPFFLTDSILYEGTQTIVRYDEGAATFFHTLFPSKSYASIVEFFSRRYGPPTQKLKRSIAPLAEPRRINPTVIWQSIAPVTNLLTTLEIRQFDDNRGGFPDTRRGAVYLYHEWSQPVFPQLSSVELMLLRAEAKQR